MSFSSFYGGRTGASFVIKKHFDGINIPPNTQFRKKYCAYMIDENDNKKYYYVDSNGLIQRTANNYTEYTWEIVEFSEKTVNTIHYSTGIKGTLTIEDEYAEGMVQCFKKGGTSTNEVNYEEYVIIDTIVGLSDYNDPDNGKIFRRGMDFLAEDGGAIYIGQIVGPQGATAEISMDSYNTISAQGDSKTGEYTPTDGLVPGKYEEGGITKFNDNIKYASVVLKDENGNVVGAEIGFEFPYLVNDFYSELISPYDSSGNLLPRVSDLIVPIGDETHPFYRQWKVSIPRGTQGDRVSDLLIKPTKSRPGCLYWNNRYFTGDPVGTLDQAYDLITIAEDYLTVEYDESVVYIKPEDGWQVELSYRITDYSQKRDGVVTEYSMGYYDILNKITLSADGLITAWYTSRDSEVLAGTPLTWINNVSLDNQTGHFEVTFNNNKVSGGKYQTDLQWINDVEIDNADGTITFKYNDGTIAYQKQNYLKFINSVNIDDSDGTITFRYNDGTIALEKQNYLKFINDVTIDDNDGTIIFTYNDNTVALEKDNYFKFINGVTLSDDGTLIFTYNDGTEALRKTKYIKSIKDVNITADGTITMTYNDDSTAIEKEKYLKVIDNITIDTDGNGGEGDGDQKVHVTYNTGAEATIGDPLNYIIESVVTGSDHLTKPFHLFVRYSDPVRRAVNPESYDGKNDWTDLGYVRGIAEGLRIITNVDSEDDLYEGPGHTNPIKPEDWASQTGDPTANTIGWGITVGQEGEQDIFVFDYVNNIWESIGSVSKVDATKIIQVSETLPVTLGKNGVWVRTEKVLYAN